MGKFQGSQQISQPGDLAEGLRTPREFDSGGQWELMAELPQDWGNRLLTLGGHKQNLVCTGTQEKGAVISQETELDMPVSVREPPMEAWVSSTEYNSPGSAGISPFDSGCHYPFHSEASGDEKMSFSS